MIKENTCIHGGPKQHSWGISLSHISKLAMAVWTKMRQVRAPRGFSYQFSHWDTWYVLCGDIYSLLSNLLFDHLLGRKINRGTIRWQLFLPCQTQDKVVYDDDDDDSAVLASVDDVPVQKSPHTSCWSHAVRVFKVLSSVHATTQIFCELCAVWASVLLLLPSVRRLCVCSLSCTRQFETLSCRITAATKRAAGWNKKKKKKKATAH